MTRHIHPSTLYLVHKPKILQICRVQRLTRVPLLWLMLHKSCSLPCLLPCFPASLLPASSKGTKNRGVPRQHAIANPSAISTSFLDSTVHHSKTPLPSRLFCCWTLQCMQSRSRQWINFARRITPVVTSRTHIRTRRRVAKKKIKANPTFPSLRYDNNRKHHPSPIHSRDSYHPKTRFFLLARPLSHLSIAFFFLWW